MDGEPLLASVMKAGRRLWDPESLDTIRDRYRQDFDALDDRVKAIVNPASYPVRIAAGLESLQETVENKVIENELGES